MKYTNFVKYSSGVFHEKKIVSLFFFFAFSWQTSHDYAHSSTKIPESTSQEILDGFKKIKNRWIVSLSNNCMASINKLQFPIQVLEQLVVVVLYVKK